MEDARRGECWQFAASHLKTKSMKMAEVTFAPFPIFLVFLFNNQKVITGGGERGAGYPSSLKTVKRLWNLHWVTEYHIWTWETDRTSQVGGEISMIRKEDWTKDDDNNPFRSSLKCKPTVYKWTWHFRSALEFLLEDTHLGLRQTGAPLSSERQPYPHSAVHHTRLWGLRVPRGSLHVKMPVPHILEGKGDYN